MRTKSPSEPTSSRGWHPRLRTRRHSALVAILVGAFLAVVGVSSGATGSGATAENSVNSIDPTLPSDTSDDWPDVVEASPEDAYVDHEVHEEDQIEGPKIAVEAGTVDDVPWSLATFLAAPDAIGGGLSEPAPCAQVFLGDEGEYGGGGACLTPLSLASGQVEIVGIAWGLASTTAYSGIVGEKVAGVELILDGDSAPHEAELVGSSASPGVRYFVIFVPNGASGKVVVHGLDKEVVVEAPLCLADAPIAAESTIGCMMNGLG